jgi:hopanoid-associated phosphorylase
MIAVVGMAFEARIAARLGVPVVCGGDGTHLERSLARAMATGCKGLISFGVAGGLAPGLRPGTCIIGSSVIDEGQDRPTDARWAQRLRRIIPDTVYGPLLGVRQPIALSGDKSALHRKTGAIGVDMESHVVARAAAQHEVPLAVIRVVVDPVERTIPRSALAGTRADGTINPLGVVKSLMRHPGDLYGLIRMSLDARAARATLVRGSALLGPGLGLLDSAARRPAIAVALEAAQADVA